MSRLIWLPIGGAVVVLSWMVLASLWRSGCHGVVLGTVTSPGGVWRAVLIEQTCSDGAFTTDVADTVRLEPAAPKPATGITVLSIDTDGMRANRPEMAWRGDHVLQLSVPIGSDPLIGVYLRQFETIRVELIRHAPYEIP